VHDHFWPVWGKGTFQEIREQPGVTLVAATEAHPDLQAKLRTDLGIERIYTDYNEMLEKEDLDGVLIALPSNAKLEPIRAAAQKGVHVMVDKPLCTTLDEACEISKIVSDTGIKLIVNSISIWKEPLRQGLELVQQGAIGRPFWVKWRNANAGSEKAGASKFFTDWLWDMEKNGGGILINYCYYGISYICHLLGRPESVSAMAGHFVKQNIPVEMEDNALVSMRWPGALGQADGSWTQMDDAAEEEIDPTNRGLIVYGTDGVLRASPKGYIVLTNSAARKGRRIECKTTAPGRWKDGGEHFAALIRGECDVDPLCSLDHNILVQEVSEAAYRSIREKREIALS
jgi:predicted dehydrogenase